MPPFPPDEIDRQLPVGDEIFLDHVGHFVREPEAASRALARAGFAPTPISIQVNPDPAGGTRPTGTGNVTGDVAARLYRSPVQDRRYAIGREFDAALERYPGAASRRLRGRGCAEGAASGSPPRPFASADLVHMERPVETEAGAATAAFTIARVEPGVMPEGRIQMLTHHTEQAVWQPRWLSHPNSAIGLIDVVIAVADVEEAAQRFARFTGRTADTDIRAARCIRLDRGGIYLVSATTGER